MGDGSRKCSLIKNVAPVEVGYLGQAVDKVGLQWHVLVIRPFWRGLRAS